MRLMPFHCNVVKSETNFSVQGSTFTQSQLIIKVTLTEVNHGRIWFIIILFNVPVNQRYGILGAVWNQSIKVRKQCFSFAKSQRHTKIKSHRFPYYAVSINLKKSIFPSQSIDLQNMFCRSAHPFSFQGYIYKLMIYRGFFTQFFCKL